uniref:RanBP2-type domain-containing protein n=1 Tax=Quercus lobata TaxID=97700 RepID=A0A7N2LF47_QUELO
MASTKVDNRGPFGSKRSRNDASRNDGDWTCPKCGNVNFGFRVVCNRGKCGAPRPPVTPGWPSFSRHILYDIGVGSRVKFWQDRWCGETSLAVRYPDLFRFCRNKDASVAELMMSANGVLFWDVRFIRSVHARDLEVMSDFMATIYGSHIRGRGEDKMCWIPNKVKGFLVSDYYRILSGTASFGFPWKSIWKQKISSKVAFFVWTAALGKCLTIDNLRKRKVWILDWCNMCKRNGESVDHLFLHCPFASNL